MKTVGIIPCRYQSSRFPGKSLAIISDKPMMWHVYQKSLQSNVLDEVYIATDDKKIQDIAKQHNMNVVMTSSVHLTGTDRVAEVAKIITADYYVNIQGDEPLLEPSAIRLVVGAIIKCDNPLIQASNAYAKLHLANDVVDSNVVKVILDCDNNALAYSRQPIPYPKSNEAHYLKQLGLYAFKKSGLQIFSENKAQYLEKTEGVEMYRLLEHGYKITMVETTNQAISVDTPNDLKRVQQIINSASQ